MIENIFTLFMLIMLQAVLGFDNLLYISLESKRAPKEHQKRVRRNGILIAIGLRILLLFALLNLIQYFQEPFAQIKNEGIVEATVNFHSLIVLAGGVFIVYTAMKEIWHMVGFNANRSEQQEIKSSSVLKVTVLITVMNLVFSFDSILSAMALTKVFWVMAVAIVVGGLMMMWLSDRVSSFLERNRMYEVLGLFILFIVGIMLVTEGGHLAHLKLFGNPIEAMSKTTFYFIIGILILIDIVQGRYQKKLIEERQNEN